MSDALPNLDDFEKALQMICGEDVYVSPSEQAVDIDSAVIGFYNKDGKEFNRAFACDLKFACGSGAALSRVPVGVVNDAVQTGDIPENLQDNIHEVMNIFMSVFQSASRDRTVLSEVLLPGDPPQGEATPETAKESKGVVSFNVDLANYGTGAVSLLAL